MKVSKPMFQKLWMSPAMFAMLLVIVHQAFLQASEPSQSTNLSVEFQTAKAQQSQSQDSNQNAVKGFTGEWKLQANFSGQRLAAIDKAVAQMGRFKQGRARDMLKKATPRHSR